MRLTVLSIPFLLALFLTGAIRAEDAPQGKERRMQGVVADRTNEHGPKVVAVLKVKSARSKKNPDGEKVFPLIATGALAKQLKTIAQKGKGKPISLVGYEFEGEVTVVKINDGAPVKK